MQTADKIPHILELVMARYKLDNVSSEENACRSPAEPEELRTAFSTDTDGRAITVYTCRHLPDDDTRSDTDYSCKDRRCNTTRHTAREHLPSIGEQASQGEEYGDADDTYQHEVEDFYNAKHHRVIG